MKGKCKSCGGERLNKRGVCRDCGFCLYEERLGCEECEDKNQCGLYKKNNSSYSEWFTNDKRFYTRWKPL